MISGGIAEGARSRFARLSQLAPLSCELTIFGEGLFSFSGFSALPQFGHLQIVRIIGKLERADLDHASTELSRKWPQQRPGATQREKHFLSVGIVAIRMPHAIAELPIGQSREDLLDLLICRFALAGRFDVVFLRIVIRVGHHALQRCEHRRRLFDGRRFDKVQAVALVTVGIEVGAAGLEDGASVRVPLQRRP